MRDEIDTPSLDSISVSKDINKIKEANNKISNIDVPPDDIIFNKSLRKQYQDLIKDDPVTSNLLAREAIEDKRADRELRKNFGEKAYNIVRKTLYGWVFLLGTYAFFRFFFNKCIFSDNVLIAITSAVTLNTFAAFLGVIRGLFPSNKPSERKIKNSD